jgi:HSP20 family protein
MRFDPFRELDRMTDQLAQQVWRETARPAAPMDAYRRGDRFLVELDVPGVDPATIDLTVEQNVLTVTAERRRSFGEQDEVLVAERPSGEFRRQLFLGEQLDTERIAATCENGVLTLTLQVAEQAKPRRITVDAAPSAQKEIVGSVA